ncbi:hypothetical protein QUF99_24815 [Bacillus sp. DX4.1]|uniref:hypothetical protein n=1 Tax=Bacillus sp. DX4.1 TaxID=3055867 RepID=UPI0025A28AB4|nr:hypothetical protein [Bacillus sp. DX4.1]MDM5190451.1 hypothetical protein [Bacillus sp. DX4.1]
MRIRIFLFSIIAVACFLLSACTNNPDDKIKKAVWDQLSEHHKEEVVGDWKNAKVTIEALQSGISSVKDSSYIGKEVYRVSFSSNRSPSLGNLDAIVDMETKKVIGFSMRD